MSSNMERAAHGSGLPITLAVIGCGAVAEKRYLPAAAQVSGLTVTHVVDLDVDRVRAVAAKHAVPEAATDHRDILGAVDAAVVATPPETHRSIVTACLEAGINVLCEKPLAARAGEAEKMVRAARETSSLLTVGMVRRLGRSAALLRRCAASGLSGSVRRIEIEEGGEFGWPLRTGHVFEAGQGGVLRDTGVHLMDLAFWVAAVRNAEVTEYNDDSWGGPEANASVEIQGEGRDGPVEISLEVSFTRDLPNRILVEGTRGVLEGDTLGGAEVRFQPAGGGEAVRLVSGDGRPRSRTEDFVLQLEEFVHAVRTGGPPPVPATDALLPLRIIEACYQRRQPVVRSWEAEPERAATATGDAPESSGESTEEKRIRQNA